MKDQSRIGSVPVIRIILMLAAVLRVIYLLDYRAGSVFWDSMLLDAGIYDEWAQRIAGGDWLSGDEVYPLPPLYPYFLAAIYWMFGHGYTLIYGLQSVLGLLNVHMTYSLGRKVLGERTGLIAAGLSVLYGSFMFTDAKLMSTTVALTLMLCLMRLLLLAGERRTLNLWGACGALLGVTVLARPETILFVPFAGWWIYRVTRRREKKRPRVVIDQYALAGGQPWFALSAFAAFVIITLSPVTLRNWVVTGDWSFSNLVSSQAGITFYQSNNPRANGLYTFLSPEGFSGNPREQAREERAIAEKDTGRTMKRSEVTRYWINRGLSWILDEPGKFFLLECKKLLRFLGSYEYSTEYIIYVERETVRSLWLTFLPFAAITALALCGMLLQLKKGLEAPAILLLLFVAANFLVVMIFYVSSRYRMPSAPFLILYAASAVERLWSGMTSPVKAARIEVIVYGGIAVALFAIFHPQVDASARIQEANVHYNAGNKYFEKEAYDEAVAEYRRAVAGDPSNWRAYFNMGNTFVKLGRREEAIEAYRDVLRRNEKMRAARQQIEALGATP